MSFSVTVKKELERHLGSGRHCQIAEISAIIKNCGEIKVLSNTEVFIKIQTENVYVARKYFTLIKKTFNINTEVIIRRNIYFKKNRVFILIITDASIGMNILQAAKLIDLENNSYDLVNQINPLLVKAICCKRAYLRGAFLVCGSISTPEKTYHLEFVNENKDYCIYLQQLINSFDMDAKIINRKKYFVVYLKEGAQIVDLLNIIEAHVALMELENIRILKEMRNNVNRLVNCETANINKTVSAAVKQVEDIQLIERTMGLEKLPNQLKEVARLRIEHSSMSLKELGALLNPPIGKSGMNHRLRKINSIAEKIRSQREDNND